MKKMERIILRPLTLQKKYKASVTNTAVHIPLAIVPRVIASLKLLGWNFKKAFFDSVFSTYESTVDTTMQNTLNHSNSPYELYHFGLEGQIDQSVS